VTNGRGAPNWSMNVGDVPSTTSFVSCETCCVRARACALTLCVAAPVLVTEDVPRALVPASCANVSLLGPISKL